MLKRKASDFIDRWITSGKNALLVSGARQVGKTFIIRDRLKQAKKKFLEINLIEKPEFISVLRNSNSIQDMENNLSLATNFRFIKGESIIFIDEIQECKDIVTRIKFWVDEGSYRYVLSGSLLGIELTDLRSVPVGYLDEIQMFPLDFEEFLWGCGVNISSIDYLRKCFEKKTPVSEIAHSTMMKHFRRYLVVGGMPAAVDKYVGTNDINSVSTIQRNIITQYRRDFTKYESEDKKLLLKAVYDMIPSQLLKQNRRFVYSDLKKGLKAERAEDSFVWLKNAGVVLASYNATEPKVALNQNKKSSLVKLYISDVGLLTCMYGNTTKLDLLMDEQKLNCGGIYENAVAQELYAHGFDEYYYNSHKLGELDFVIEYKGSILPLEIKSGKDYSIHSAINNVLDIEDFNINQAFVLSNYNISTNSRITYYPIYMSMFITNETKLPKVDSIPDIDLESKT